MSQALYRKPCARSLDRPIVVFGLEPEDLVAVGGIAIGLLFLSDGVIAVGTGLGLWGALVRLKAGKPAGHLYYLAHRAGLLDRLPPAWRAPQVLPRRVARLSPFPGEDDDDLARDWWSGRPAPPLEAARLGVGGADPAAADPRRAGGRRGAGFLARLAAALAVGPTARNAPPGGAA